jgi:DNA-binding NtrC family response regulator
MIFSGGYTIQVHDLPWGQGSQAASGPSDEAFRQLVLSYLDACSGEHAYAGLVEKIERLLIAEALRRSAGNQTRAAQLLGLPRPTLHAKMQKLGLHDRSDEE